MNNYENNAAGNNIPPFKWPDYCDKAQTQEKLNLLDAKQTQANEKQVGGKHYKQFKYQPWDVVVDWNLGYLDGTALKYIARWKDKNGLEDIKKAIHFLEKLLEVESGKNGG